MIAVHRAENQISLLSLFLQFLFELAHLLFCRLNCHFCGDVFYIYAYVLYAQRNKSALVINAENAPAFKWVSMPK